MTNEKNTEKLNKTNIEIIEVKTKRERKKFVRFPTWLYKDNKFYVHPFEYDEMKMFSHKNPSWDEVILKAFLAIRNKKVVGRIAVIVHKSYNIKNNTKYARFTRYDFIDDKAVATALMQKACDFAREQGMEVIHGPLGFNDLDKEGLLVEGFDKLSTFGEVYNYAYYKNHIEEFGFEKEVDWVEFKIMTPKKLDERIAKISDKMTQRLNLHFLPPNMSTKKIVKLYGEKVFNVLNKSYADLHGVTPITPKVRDSILAQFKMLIRGEFICLVLDNKDDVVGFALTAPNISRSLSKSKGRLLNFGFIPFNALRLLYEARHPKNVDMCLIAVIPEYRGKGVNAIIISEMFKILVKNKIKAFETNLELENNNDITGQWDSFNPDLIKRRRCYTKKL